MTRDLRAAFAKAKAALLRRGRSVHEAEDLVQEAWLRLACYEEDQAVAKPEAFLMRAALNLSIDAARRHQRQGDEVQLEDAVLVDLSPGVEAILLARERVARLSVCLSRLNTRTREVFLAHRIEGLSYPQIAQRHRISVETVERDIARALMQLTAGMEGW